MSESEVSAIIRRLDTLNDEVTSVREDVAYLKAQNTPLLWQRNDEDRIAIAETRGAIAALKWTIALLLTVIGILVPVVFGIINLVKHP